MSKMLPRRPILLGLSTGLLVSISASIFSIAVSADPVSNGKQAFSLCVACHRLDGKNGVGPYLNGVIGRKAGELEGFRYSRPMKSSGGVWTAEALDKFLQNPQAAMPGNRMPFSGLPDADKRADIIAYLATVKQPPLVEARLDSKAAITMRRSLRRHFPPSNSSVSQLSLCSGQARRIAAPRPPQCGGRRTPCRTHLAAMTIRLAVLAQGPGRPTILTAGPSPPHDIDQPQKEQ